MKKVILGSVLMLIATVSYAKEYSCQAYLSGEPVGEAIKVNASKTLVAEAKARQRLKKADLEFDIVRCK